MGGTAFLSILLIPVPAGMTTSAQGVMAVTLLMAIWWIFEVLPLAVTGLLPIVLYPVLGIMDPASAAAPYAHYVNFLILGGFFIGITLEKWNLHKRIALTIISKIGHSASGIMMGFMLASYFLSMWISNVATAIMMVPIGISVIDQVYQLTENQLGRGKAGHIKKTFGVGLMLCIIYAGNIGGMSTLIGTPSNAVLAGMVSETYHQDISFLDWLKVAFPFGLLLLVLAWYYLSQIGFKMRSSTFCSDQTLVNKELKALGPMIRAEQFTLMVLAATAVCWVLRSLVRIDALGLINDATIAVFFGLLLFVIPADKKWSTFLLDWQTALKIPWGVLLLLGGGLALASGIKETGLDGWIASYLSGINYSGWYLVMLTVVVITIFLTQIASNVATTTILVPILGGIATTFSMHPYALIIAAGISASFAFMLPTATPGNSIIFSYQHVTVRDMIKHGLILNLLGIALIPLLIRYFLPLVWDIDLSSLPNWAIPGT